LFGSALYHPYIDIRDGRWLRSAILFWDEIQTIAPTSISRPYRERDTIVCEQEGYLRPLHCDLHGDLLNQLGKRVIGLVQNPEFDLLGGPDERALIHAAKLGHSLKHEIDLARLHPQKVSPELLALFPGARRTQDQDAEWLLVDGRFANAYMAALAAALAREVEVSPLTSEEISLGINLRCLLDDVGSSDSSAAKGALLTVTLESLRIDPQVPVERLIAFRRSRANQLADLSATFDDLKNSIIKSEEKRELKEKAKRVFSTRVRPKLESLKAELAGQTIQSAWEGFQRAITITLPSGSALAIFGGWPTEVALGVGASLAIADVGVRSYFARQKARASPYTYLLDVERKFSQSR
jgi:hypothetical protein